MEFRTLRPDELRKWFDFLCCDIFPDDPREAVESMWRGCDESACEGVFIAVLPSGRVVGSVMAACRTMPVRDVPVTTGIISGAGVSPEFRGQHISAQLFALCDAFLLSRGAKIAHLYSKPDTLAYYTKLGYGHLPQRADEDFFRMYRVLMPVSIGSVSIPDTPALIDSLS